MPWARAGTFIYIANRDSDTVVAFRFDTATWRGYVANVGSPVSTVFR